MRIFENKLSVKALFAIDLCPFRIEYVSRKFWNRRSSSVDHETASDTLRTFCPHSHDDPIHFGLKLYLSKMLSRASADIWPVQRSKLLLHRKWPIATEKESSSEHTIQHGHMQWKRKESPCSLIQPSDLMVAEISITLFILVALSQFTQTFGRCWCTSLNSLLLPQALSTRRSRKYGYVSAIERLNGQLFQKMTASKSFTIFRSHSRHPNAIVVRDSGYIYNIHICASSTSDLSLMFIPSELL